MALSQQAEMDLIRRIESMDRRVRLLETLEQPQGKLVQVVSTISGAFVGGNTTIPIDDTIPQNTEGVANANLDTTITPKSATNILDILVILQVAPSAAGYLIGALFKDAGADALRAGWTYFETASGGGIITIRHSMVAGGVVATTFKVRAGHATTTPGTIAYNGLGGARYLGGVAPCSVRVIEYVP